MNYLPFQLSSIILVPCVPDFTSGNYIPVYNLGNIPENLSQKVSVLPRGGMKNKPWAHEEDVELVELVKKFGVKKWAKIAKVLNSIFENHRKGKNCRERWKNHLDPSINKGEWSYEEDLTLLVKYQELGRKWSIISKAIEGRTENAVKNRWNTLVKSISQTLGNNNQDIATHYLINHIRGLIDKN